MNKAQAAQQEKPLENIRILPERSRFCICCGARLASEDIFCMNCGARIEEEAVEQEETVTPTETVSKISNDRMASIAETTARKFGAAPDFLLRTQQNEKEKEKNSTLQLAVPEQKKFEPFEVYVNKMASQTMYLKIENITGSTVKVSIKTVFNDGSYGIENYDGVLSGIGLTLRLSNYSLNTQYQFKLGESFLGIVEGDTISGSFAGEFTAYCVFKKE